MEIITRAEPRRFWTLAQKREIVAESFGPDLTVAAGTTITWTNHDDVPHVVASDSNIFKSKVLDTNEKFTFVFTQPGTFTYICTIHPRMRGTIVVQ